MTLPVETLVERRLLNMSLKQLELRCRNNTVHYVLNEEHSKDALLNSNELRQILGKTPKFLPTPGKLKPMNVARDCDKFNTRLIKTFKRFIHRDFISQANANSASNGIVQWKPAEFPYTTDYYARYTQEFFDVSKPSGSFWRSHQALCPQLAKFTTSFKADAVNIATGINKRTVRVRFNLSRTERTLLRNAQDRQVGFNNSDKNYGPVLYSRDLYLKQCHLLLYDEKGTYMHTAKPKDLILQEVVHRLKCLVHDCLGIEPATRSLANTLKRWADDSLNQGRLCKFYVIWKLHKQANSRGVRSRPIASNIGYPTGQISHFLHSQLIGAVNKHEHVLKDSLSLIRLLEATPISPDQNILLTSADVVALYPSINIEDGMTALEWFMAEHTSLPKKMQSKYLRLARFVLENNYVECEGLDGVFLQKVGTAMGTSFSVTYATIFMIWLETPIINEFRKHIVLYKRYIDDILLIWSGSYAELCRFRARFGSANDNIKLEWQNTPSSVDANHPARIAQDQHRRVSFLDLDLRVVYSTGSAEFAFKVYRKTGNAYAYLPYGSYHARHVFRGWLKAEMHRLLTHSSSPAVWLEECRFFYEHLRNRGYPAKAINACFREINWNQRQKMLEPKKKKDTQDTFFTKYRGCVFSSRNAPGINALRQELNLSLDDLRRDSAGHDIFPQRAYFAVKSAMSMASILRR